MLPSWSVAFHLLLLLCLAVPAPAAEPARRRLSAEDLARLWDDLGKVDAPRGQRALWALVEDPDTAIPFLEKHISRTAPTDRDRIARLIEQLDDDAFAVREAAYKALDGLAETATGALREALAHQPSAEKRWRLERLLARHGKRTRLRPPGDGLRAARAVEVLERIGTPPARRVLEAQARGPLSSTAEDARAALRRLGRHREDRSGPPTRADAPARLRHAGPVYALAFSPDDRLLASAAQTNPLGRDDVIHLWDAATGKAVRVCRSRPCDAWALAFSADGSRLASAGWDGRLLLWEVATGKQLAELAGPSFPSSRPALAFSADGKLVRVWGDRPEVQTWNSSGSRTAGSFLLPQGLRSLPAFSGDAGLLAAYHSDEGLHVVDVANGKKLLRLESPRLDIKLAAFSPDGRYLATEGAEAIPVWELASAERVCTLPAFSEDAMTFSPNGRTLAAASWDGRIRLWDVVTGKQRRLLRVGPYPAALVFSHDGKKLAIGCRDGVIHVFDTAAGK